MKTLIVLIALLASATVTALAVPISFNIQGTISNARIVNLTDLGIRPGDAFQCLLNYDSDMALDARGAFTGTLSQYMSVTINGLQFASVGPNFVDIWVRNNFNNTGQDQFLAELSHGLGPITSPWGEPTVLNTSNIMNMFLLDPSGTALGLDTSLESASDIDLTKWPVHEIQLGAI